VSPSAADSSNALWQAAHWRREFERLRRRGLVDDRDGTCYIVDPLFAEWLRRASPLVD
jgi:hypothetical protein